MGDLEVCELECLGKKSKKQAVGARHEFVGPVKIVLVESTVVDYQRKVWGSAVFTFVMLLMGATVFTVLFFSLSFKLPFIMNIHIVLCTIGFQLFMTTGIMMFSTLFGGSMHLKTSDRKFQHFFLEICSVLFGVVGTVFALGKMAFTLHALTGFFTAVMSVVSCFVGPTVYVADPEKLFGLFNKPYHRNVAVPTFVMSLLAVGLQVVAFISGPVTYFLGSDEFFGQYLKNAHIVLAVNAFVFGNLCFVFGLLKESFINWAPVDNLSAILIILCILFSAGALATIYLRVKFHL